jgi:hypothetical protein
VKEKASTPALIASDDDMNPPYDDESSFISYRSPPPTCMDINMVFMLSAKFRDAEEEVAQMCLSPKEVMCEKPEESSQHLELFYIQGHIDGKQISRMHVDGGATVNLMSYTVKTNLTFNGVGAT